MNELVQWLAEIKEFNDRAKALAKQCKSFEVVREGLESDGKALGLKVTKIRAMLIKLKLTVKMPEEGHDPKA